jgi:alkanesulfonate monooxygenase SsuD/methylene tetrahydromethanopterin reductase-like flavin-dependent oxidoreductase (luciferase family)
MSAAMPNPMRLPGHFKLGLFGYLHDGGNCFTKVPERWRAEWTKIAEMAKLADRAGLDFLLPISRWKGVPGDLMQRLHSYETLTHAATLCAYTSRISILSTVHTPLIHPIVAAKSLVTIDHASGGRAGLNIVCGWNTDDFEMFGKQTLPHSERYQQAWEWFQIWSRLVAGAPEPFDFDGAYFPNHKQLTAMPGAVQRPHPLVVSAAFSRDGRDFAVRTSDILFTFFDSFEAAQKIVLEIEEKCARSGRQTPLGVVAVAYVVCRETRDEAEDYHCHYAQENEDTTAVDYYLSSRARNASMPEADYREMRLRFAAGNGGFPLIGTPEDVAAGLIEIARSGYAGASLSMVNFLDELPLVVEKVLPILRRAGLRLQ